MPYPHSECLLGLIQNAFSNEVPSPQPYRVVSHTSICALKLQVSFAKEHYKRDDMIHSHMQRGSWTYATGLWVMGWLRWVGSLQLQVSFAKEHYKRDDMIHSHMQRGSWTYATGLWVMGWLRLVGSFKLQVSFAKEHYKRDYILQNRPIILRSLLIVATPYRRCTHSTLSALCLLSTNAHTHLCEHEKITHRTVG